MSFPERFGHVDIDLEEDESVLDRVFLEVDVWKTIVFAFLVLFATTSLTSMSILLVVYKPEVGQAGIPISNFARFGLFAALACLFFAVCTLAYRFQNGISLNREVRK